MKLSDIESYYLNFLHKKGVKLQDFLKSFHQDRAEIPTIEKLNDFFSKCTNLQIVSLKKTTISKSLLYCLNEEISNKIESIALKYEDYYEGQEACLEYIENLAFEDPESHKCSHKISSKIYTETLKEIGQIFKGRK